jgi:CBS domain-containing protein
MEDLLSGIVDRRLVAISPDASVGAAKKLAHNARVSMLPVVSNNKLVGTVEIESIAYKDAQIKVKEVMVKPIFVEETAPLSEARKIIIKHGLSRLPVVESAESMTCVGTISSSDLI